MRYTWFEAMIGFAYPAIFFVHLFEQVLPVFGALSQLLAVPLPYAQQRASLALILMAVTVWLEWPPKEYQTGSEEPQTQ